MCSSDLGVTGRQAEIINLAYKQRLLTADDWAKLPSMAFQAILRRETDTGIDVQPGDMILVCPNPEQKWRKDDRSPWTTYDGRIPGGNGMAGGQVLAAKIISEGNPASVKITPESGVLFRCPAGGRLHLGSTNGSFAREGFIECKVFKITVR